MEEEKVLKSEKLAVLKGMSQSERRALMDELRRAECDEKVKQREAYEGMRDAFASEVLGRLVPVVDDVKMFRDWLAGECEGFRSVMAEYGKLRSGGQESWSIVSGDFRLEVKSNKVKCFDERADMAAERLVDYLKRYVEGTDKGTEDAMYQLAMTLLERNKMGDLDYKSISKLYELEDRFDAEYGEIMGLFKESNVVMKTAINYYFSRRDKEGVWRRLEPSFCRL